MIGRQWVSLNSLNCKMLRGKTNILYFLLSRCKKNSMSMITNKQYGNIIILQRQLQYIEDQDDNIMFLSLLYYQTFTVPGI